MGYFQTFDEALLAYGFIERSPGQRKVFNAFRNGKHIILKAPTGWGKTFAVTAAIKENHAIYSLPLRVLVDSLAKDVEKSDGIFPKKIAVQHGARKEHAFLDKGDDTENPIDLVFTTLDQSLSAYLGIPIAVGYRQGNILPAVIDSSHLIFDEFHLLDPRRSMTTALYAIKQSQQNCIILTATLSSTMLNFLKEELLDSPIGKTKGVEIVVGERPFINEKRIIKGTGLDNDLENIELGEKTIIIRNRIEAAKETAKAIRRHYPDTDVYLLHSELLTDHRRSIELEVKNKFKKSKGQLSKKQILIATQVVEAGIDISCDIMHTDICPPSSLIQRLGRSARYEGEHAKVFWHDIQDSKLAPYQFAKEDIQKLRILLTKKNNEILTTQLEDEIIEISKVSDEAFTKYFKTRSPAEETLELRTIRDYEQYKERIRDINSINTAIGNSPDKSYKFISINRGKFYGQRFDKIPVSFYRYSSELKSFESLSGEKAMVQLADFALLSPEHIGYCPSLGLDPSLNNGEEFFINDSSVQFFDYEYQLEPYEAHIQLLHKEKKKVKWIIDALSTTTDLGGTGHDSNVSSRELAEGLVDFVIWAHDLGKLNPKWQLAHQVDIGGIPINERPLSFFTEELELDLLSIDYPIAHSESNGKYARRKDVKIPSHAWVSAWAVKDMLYEIVQKEDRLFYPVFWAIAEHHGYLRNFSGELTTKRFEEFELGYTQYLDQLSSRSIWKKYGWDSSYLTLEVKKKEAQHVHLWFDSHPLMKDHAVNIYYALSYILRRCDQLATSYVSKKVKKEKNVQENKSDNII